MYPAFDLKDPKSYAWAASLGIMHIFAAIGNLLATIGIKHDRMQSATVNRDEI